MTKSWAGHGRRRRTFNAHIKARDRATPGYTCPRCRRPINWDLTWPHHYSPSVDHITELQDGGPPLDPNNAWTMHLRCNASKGATRAAQRRNGNPHRPDNTDNGIIIGDPGSV